MSNRGERGITERVLIEGTLVLETPTHLGNGSTEALTDMPLQRDVVEGNPLLTGTSLAGALRNYVREYEHGYTGSETAEDRAQALFGAIRNNHSLQSWLMVDDALGESTGIELRDGVAIDPKTRTAQDKKKFDMELLQAGTTFPLSLELQLPEGEHGDALLKTLTIALRGLENGEIGLGMRKRRGLGRCRVTGWKVRRYRMTRPSELLAWLENDARNEKTGPHIAELLGVSLEEVKDARSSLTIRASLGIEGALLIRSGTGMPNDPDMIHLHSYRPDRQQAVPILSGTSLAGAIRARALRILQTVLSESDPDEAKKLIDALFGPRIEQHTDKPQGSRLVVQETEITGGLKRVQQRLKIDRFTGGAYPTALFCQVPLFGGSETEVQITLELRQPRVHEIGLLMLILKDLWTGDLPLGGESSAGRGRLYGRRAEISYREPDRHRTWNLIQGEDGRLHLSGTDAAAELESYVEAFQKYGRAE